MLKVNLSLKVTCLYICIFGLCLISFGQADNNYYRLVDSADTYIDENSEKALAFLDAIPKPVEQHIEGRLAEYYSLKTLIYDDFKDYTNQHQSIILTIKYAEKENNYCVAGEAYVNLFSNLYYIKNDTTAYKYLEEARLSYKKCKYEYGALEVDQVEAYAKFLKGEYQACNTLLLQQLENYKNIREEAYYYMFALYMLTSNYIYMDDMEKAHTYYNEFKKLKDNATIVKYNYFAFEAAIKSCFADVFLNKKQLDSTLYYLKNSAKLKGYMGEDILNDYYSLFASTYKYLGDIERSKAYVDSLMLFQKKMHNQTVKASFEVSDELLTAESELIEEYEKQKFITILSIIIIVAILLLISLLGFIYYKKQKHKLEIFSDETNSSLSYLKSNNEQLAVKVHGLEAYIKNVKKEIKQISRTESIDQQKIRIKELYNSLHINSSTVLDKSENHLDLVTELNIEFFKTIEEKYPKLNKSEIIICYYLFMGFTNKEIAVFLNTTIRSVESRRYRISKKMNLSKKSVTLLDYLHDTFSHTLKNNE